MNLSQHGVAFVCCVLFAQGCTTNPAPHSTASDRNSAATPSAVSAQPTSTPTTAPAATKSLSGSVGSHSATVKPRGDDGVVLDDKTLTNAEVRQILARGYRPIERDGQIYYCRRDQETGSRFTVMDCSTGEHLKQVMQDSQDVLSTVQRPGGCRANAPTC